jgi:TM2 domain-containing membrane protein YozV
MFCKNCGTQLNDQAAFCTSCGATTQAPPAAGGFCPNCGAKTDPVAAVCVKCGVALTPAAMPGGELKSKLAAGLLGIFLGGLGVHRFYLGYTLIGICQILVTVVGGIITCGIGWIAGGIWGLVEGILILTGTINKDAQGRPLRE